MYIAVAGNLGSGKSTLAERLGAALACRVHPLAPSDPSYLSDLFREPKRWSFEAQAAFLANKFRSITEALSIEGIFVLDRSMREDVEIFCRYFHENGHMDERGYRTIVDMHQALSNLVKPPSIILYCRCSPRASRKRIASRPPRSYQTLYPEDHIEKLERMYKKWIKQQVESVVFEIDTEKHDVRDEHTVARIIEEINNSIDQYVGDLQLPLFGPVGYIRKGKITKLQTNTRDKLAGLSTVQPRKLRVYMAAPFTAVATPACVSERSESLSLGTAIDIIPEGPYRRGLLALARSIGSWGHEVVLPHRDINDWGRNDLPPGELARRCVEAVRSCDLFVGLIRESFGSHVELGVALGAGIPSAVIATADGGMSFFGGAIVASNSVTVINVPSINKAAKYFRNRDIIREMLARAPGEGS